MTIVITGATGHLGRLTLDALLARGVAPDQLVAGGRQTQKLDDFAARGVRVVPLDYGDASTLHAALVGAEQVFLISGSEVGQRVAQHAAVIEAGQRSGIAHLVYTSAPKATTSDLILAPEHKATEEKIAASGIPATILRNGWYTENYVQNARQGIATGEIVSSVGTGRVASASRIDFAEAAAAVLTDPRLRGQVYELAADTAWDFDELAATTAEIAGRDVVYRDVTPEEHTAILLAAGLPPRQAGFVVALQQNIKAGLLGETGSTFSELIGRPTTPLAVGLREALAAS